MDPIALIVKAAQQEKDRLRAPPEAMKSPLVNDIVKSDDDHDHDDDESDDMDPIALIVKAAQQEKEKQNEKARKIATPNEAAQQELVKLDEKEKRKDSIPSDATKAPQIVNDDLSYGESNDQSILKAAQHEEVRPKEIEHDSVNPVAMLPQGNDEYKPGYKSDDMDHITLVVKATQQNEKETEHVEKVQNVGQLSELIGKGEVTDNLKIDTLDSDLNTIARAQDTDSYTVGSPSSTVTKEEKAKRKAEKAKIKEEKARLKQEKARLKEEKAKIKAAKKLEKEEKSKLKEKARVSQLSSAGNGKEPNINNSPSIINTADYLAENLIADILLDPSADHRDSENEVKQQLHAPIGNDEDNGRLQIVTEVDENDNDGEIDNAMMSVSNKISKFNSPSLTSPIRKSGTTRERGVPRRLSEQQLSPFLRSNSTTVPDEVSVDSKLVAKSHCVEGSLPKDSRIGSTPSKLSVERLTPFLGSPEKKTSIDRHGNKTTPLPVANGTVKVDDVAREGSYTKQLQASTSSPSPPGRL
jgi:hypothetical protein